MEPYHWIPLLNAIVYTVGALCIKRATNDGVGPWRSTFVSNLVLFLVSLPFWWLGDGFESWSELWIPLVIGTVFFLGQLLVCLAIHKGDVSLITPLLGTKTVLIAVVATLGFGEALGSSVWIGAFLSMLAVLLMRGGSVAERKRLLPTIYLGLGSSLFYALNDVFTQHYGRQLGFSTLVASVFTVVMLWSFALVPLFRSPMSSIGGKAWSWMGAGAFLMSLQAGGMAYVLSNYGKATVVNIVYSSRGIWSVALVWVVGHWFSNNERAAGKAELTRRLIGALLLIGAIGTVMR